MSLINMPEWDLEISAQGKHSTDVDLNGIKIFLQLIAAKQFFDYIASNQSEDGLAVDLALVSDSFFKRGTWQLNVERKQLLGSNHYHSGTLRVYEETGFHGVRVVVHLPSGERRYGHLHPPKAMRTEEARQSLITLRRCFSDPEIAAVEEAYEEAYQSSRKVDKKSQGFKRLKTIVQPMARAYDHTRAIFRSNEKKIAFTEHLWKVSKNGTCALRRSEIDRLLENHWNKFRGDSRIAFNGEIEQVMLGQAIIGNIVIETSCQVFSLGEYAEILINDHIVETERQRRESVERKVTATKKLITRLEEDMRKLELSLTGARQKLKTLRSSL